MVSQRKKKYQTGEGSQYWSRNTALRKLQLSLKDFRRLCILKGIYPREPRSRKRAQRGGTGIQTLYHKKDIQFLLHEPIIWKLRDIKVHGRKIGRAKSLHEYGKAKKLIKKPPVLNLDHIVKERYPTFLDALRDLDDCLTLCFLFSTFPSLRHVPRDQSILCRRLTMEFLHAVIEGKLLRKVFISIKGFYFQAEIKNIPVTWIIPHHFSFEPQSKEEVDFRIMSTFVQFYIVMLGFVNFRLYHTLNLYYPPKFSVKPDSYSPDLVDKQSFISERVAALNSSISSKATETAQNEEEETDVFEVVDGDADKIEAARLEAQRIKKLKTLFKGLKVFLGREVPREPLTFILRCFDAEVSWDKDLFIGSTFSEDDETITHQIVDRPTVDKQFLSRYYVQPQWVFDSINARELLPVEKYFIGCTLPPHLSPFVDSTRTQYYIPPEAQNDLEFNDDSCIGKTNESLEKDASEISSEEEEQLENNSKDVFSGDESGEQSSSELEDNDAEMERREKTNKMSVEPGIIEKEDPEGKKREERQEYKLREKMVPKKYRALYKSMMKGRAERMTDVRVLKRKRILLDKKKGNLL